MKPRHAILCIGLFVCLIAGSVVGFARSVTLTWYGPSGPLVAQVAQEIAAEYTKLNPGVTIEVLGQSTETHSDVLLTQMAAGIVPDIVFIEQSHLAWWAHQGLLQPVDGLAEAVGIEAEEFIPASWEALQFEGEQYALPLLTEPYGLMWSRHMLDEAGIPSDRAPVSWDEMVEFARKLVRHDGDVATHWGAQFAAPSPIFSGSTALNLGAQLDVPTVENARAMFDDPRWQRVFALIVEMEMTQGGPSAWSTFERQYRGQQFTAIQQGLAHGRLGYAHSGSWLVNQVYTINPESSLGVGPLPVVDGGKQIITSKGWALGIPVNAPNPEEAMKFLRFLYSEAPMELWYRKQSSLPSHLDSLRHLILQVIGELNSEARLAFAQLATGVNAVTPPNLPVSQTLIRDVHLALQRVRGYEENAAQALLELNTDLNNRLLDLND